MNTFPQLIDEDIQKIDGELQELLSRTEATSSLIIDTGGFLIASKGDAQQFDLTTIAALASGAYMANQTIANLVHETGFNSVYQQGERFSMFVICVDQNCLLAVIFNVQVSVGVVKHYAKPAVQQIAAQLRAAQARDSGAGIDLSMLNMADAGGGVFRKQD